MQGTPETARAAIDAAWGIVPDARGGPLGTLVRELDVEAHPPAATLALLVTDDLRARAPGVARFRPTCGASRGASIWRRRPELDAQAVFDDGARAATAAARWGRPARARAEPDARLMGLAPLVDGAQVAAEGARVHGRLRIPEDKREALAERVLLLLQAVARQRGPSAPQP